ncbi:MAG: ribosomal-processing cysteine protease Prp [Acetatifactor sp.]|nr:ribosomal-processing cysteine protease Prp [Acetatifactor sp.]
MTTIEITMNKECHYRQIVCMGHAEYAKAGEPDILCAAISMLVTGTMNSLEALAGEQIDAVTNEETGFMKFTFSTEKPLQEKSTFLLDSMVFNLEMLSKEYGKKYLQVKFKEV